MYKSNGGKIIRHSGKHVKKNSASSVASNNIKRKIRVFICDTWNIPRQGLRILLEREQDIEVVAEAFSTYQALEICNMLHPDVIVILPGINCIDFAKQIRSRFSDIKIVAVQSYIFKANITSV